MTVTTELPTRTIDNNGIVRFTVNGQPHNDTGPAIIYPDGTQIFCQRGLLHNDTGPALVLANGSTYHYTNGHPVETDTAAAA